MAPRPDPRTVSDHFANRPPGLAATYAKILRSARKHGPVREEPKKTSIHLANTTAFAGIAVQKASIILTLKSKTDIKSPRIAKREQVSANRWHLEIRLDAPEQVDAELERWLTTAYRLTA